MRNFTRDINHRLCSGIYCKNMNALVITLDGKQLNSRRVMSVYRNAVDRAPYVQMIREDAEGNIIVGARGPETYELEGVIGVDGTPAHCHCYQKRRIVRQWWTRIDREKGSW